MTWLEYALAFGPWMILAIVISKDISDDLCDVPDRQKRPWLYHD
jgi:hypothetical protein